MITTFVEEPGRGRGLAPHRVHPQQRPARRQAELHDHLEPLRAPRLPGAAERPVDDDQKKEIDDKAGQRADDDPGAAAPASAVRATAASTTPRATAPPARRCARSTATSTRSSTATSILGKPYSVGARERRGQGRPDPQVQARRARPARRRLGADPLPVAAAALMATAERNKKSARRRQLEAAINYPIDWLEERSGLVGGDQVLPLPQGPGRHRLVAHTRLGDADRLPRAGAHRRDPGDVLQARSRRARTSRSSTSRTTSRSAGSCAACTSGARASSSS